MIKPVDKRAMRKRRHRRIRMRLAGTPERPRLSVFRSAMHIYAQIIDDSKGHTLVQASSLDKELANVEPAIATTAQENSSGGKKGGNPPKDAKAAKGGAVTQSSQQSTTSTAPSKKIRIAQQVGTLLARRAQEKGIKKVVFDRGGYLYHGRIKALADAARAAGLEF